MTNAPVMFTEECWANSMLSIARYYGAINYSGYRYIIVDKLGVEESEVTETANFTNDLGADSLDTVELLLEFEKVFDIKIPDEETSTIATVKDAIDKVNEKLQAK